MTVARRSGRTPLGRFQRDVGPNLVVVDAPEANLVRASPRTKILVAHLAVEALGKRVLDRLAWPNDVQLHAGTVERTRANCSPRKGYAAICNSAGSDRSV